MADESLFEFFYIFITGIVLHLNLVFHLLIFTGSFVITLKNKTLPQWHIVPLWWVGLGSGFCSLTIVFQFIFGKAFILSYSNIGLILETALNGCLAILAATFLVRFFLTHTETSDRIVKKSSTAKKSVRKYK